MNKVRASCMKTYAPANSRPSPSNACGIDADSSMPASISANSIVRTGGLVGVAASW